MNFSKLLLVTLLLVPQLTQASAGIDAPTLFEQGKAFLRAHAYPLALDRFTLAGLVSKNDSEKAEALRWTGEANLRNQQYDRAVHDFLTAQRLDPLSNNASGSEFKTAIALVYAKNYKASLEHLKNLEGEDKDIEVLSDIYFWEAEDYYQMGQYKNALKLYETILRQNQKYPHTQLVNYLVDWCYFQLKDYDNAYDGFSGLVSKAKDPTLAKLSTFQAAECRFWQGRYDDALLAYGHFAQIYADDPMAVAAFYGLGWTLSKQEKHAEAAKQFQKIVADYPKHPLAPWAAVRAGAEDYAILNNDQALKDYQSGLPLCGGKTPSDYLEYGIAWLNYSQQKYDEAIALFKGVEGFGPQSDLYWNALYLRAGCLYLEAKYDDSKKNYELIQDPAPKELVQAATYWMGWCDYTQGNYDQALKSFAFVAQNTTGETQARGYWGSGECHYRLGRYAQASEAYEKALANNPPNDVAADCDTGLGWTRFQQGDFSAAAEAFAGAVEKSPNGPRATEALLRLADSFYNLHEYAKASDNYQKALAGNPSSLDAKEQLGWCAYHQEQFDQAVSLWGKLLQDDNAADRRPRLLYWSAWAHFRNKDFKAAQGLFAAVEAQYPNDTLAPEAHLREGDCYFNQQQFKEAKDLYQSFVDRYPTHSLLPDALYGLQWSAEKLGLKDEAAQVAKNFLSKFPDSSFASSIQYRLADTYYQNKKYPEAVDIYDQLLKKYPDSLEAPKAMFWRGMSLYKSDKKPEAIMAFEDLIKKYPNDPLTLEGQFSLGSLYYDSGDFKNALDNYQHLFQTNPAHHLATHALFNSAVCEKELGDSNKALEYYQKLANDYPKDPLAAEADLQQGVLLEKLNEPDKALKAYETTIATKDPNLSAEAAFYHADIYKSKADYDKAIDEFNSLITTYPDQDQWVVTSYAKVAECYEAQKKYQDAANTYKLILKYTKVKTYRDATNKRLKALQPFLHKTKKSKVKSTPVPVSAEAAQ